MADLNSKVLSATKWSSITEIVAKLVTPVSTMVLARLLTPEAFGVLVTAVMIISFAEIFTDAGFQKYLIQREFGSEEEKEESTTVAFWSNLCLSLVIWTVIILFADEIAVLVGNEGHGDVIAVSCVCIPLAAFSSIQMALFKRRFDFKTLFLVRLVGVLIPLVVTIPLAYLTRSYWALIIGMVCLNLSNAVLLTVKSPWKPRWFYKFSRLKEMLSFSIWSMIEAVSIWATSYVDLFIIGALLNQHYLGLYRTAITTAGQITSIIISATTPVLFSSLSRLQNNEQGFREMFLRFQKIVGLFIIPMGVGIYLFRDFVTDVLLGPQWLEIANFLGLWGLINAVAIVFSHYSSEVYRAKGRPKWSVFVQISQIVCIVPTVLWSIRYGFDVLCEARALVRLQAVVVNLFIMYLFVKISLWTMIKNVGVSLIATIGMVIVVLVLPSCQLSIFQNIVYIVVATIIYFGIILSFRDGRMLLLNAAKMLHR